MRAAPSVPIAMRRDGLVVLVLCAVALTMLPACSSSSKSAATTQEGAASRGAASPPRSKISVWGDSLTVQAAPALEDEGRARNVDVVVHAYFGLAPCDVIRAALSDIRSGIDALVLAFSGNNLTPCMSPHSVRLQGSEYFAAYRRDMSTLASAARAHHVPTVIVGPPGFPPAQNHPDRGVLNAVLRSVAEEFGARYAPSAPLLTPTGFTRTLPCLPGETAALGCRAGRITVRSGNGIHFDPLRHVPCPEPRGCQYSAGAHRFADVMLSALDHFSALTISPARSGAGVPLTL